MKQNKWIALLLALMMAASLLAGCGAKSSQMSMDTADMAMEAPVANESFETDSGAGSIAGSVSEAVQTGQKLIRTVNITAETEDLDALLPQVLNQVSALQGYVESQEQYNGSSSASYRRRNVSLTIRIPADRLDGFLGQVKDVSNVVSYSESQEDVTLTYVSTESRIKALETEQERLLELLSKAENMTDLLEIESRLTEVRYELENVTSRLRVLANQVDYATVYLYINQVKVYTEVEEQTLWQRISSGFGQNLQNVGEGLQDFFVWIVTYSPQLVILAAIIALVVGSLRRRAKKRRAGQTRQTPPQAWQMPPQTPPQTPPQNPEKPE